MEPTVRQQRVLDFIAGFISEHGYSPTFREMKEGLGFSGPNAVLCHLKALGKKGYITRGKTSRSIQLLRQSKCPYCKQKIQ